MCTETNHTGRYSLSVPVAGDYVVAPYRPGHTFFTDEARLGAGEVTKIDILSSDENAHFYDGATAAINIDVNTFLHEGPSWYTSHHAQPGDVLVFFFAGHGAHQPHRH